MGALRLDQGAGGVRRPGARAGGHLPALRLPQVPRLRRLQRHARPARPDPPRGGAPRHGRQRQARPRRHPRDRVHRPGVPGRRHPAGPPGRTPADHGDHRSARGRRLPGRHGRRRGRRPAGADGGDGSTAEFARLGYRDAPRAAAHLAGLRASGRYQQMPTGIRSRFDALVPRVIEECAAQPDPDTTLNRVLTLLETISRRAAYLALLQQYPQALARVAHLVGASSWAATYLNRHPLLLDELIDPRLLTETPDWSQFQAELAAQLDEAEPDTERQMDLMREAHHAQVFRLLVQDLAGKLTVERLADHLSEAADRVLGLTLNICWRKLARRHREAPQLAIVAYGKHGGKELGYASDLDLIFVHDDDAPDAPELYARLVQRVNTWLTTRTAAGMLFETDLRLRPNGDAGLPVVSMHALRKYQLENAWVWEHQALTRARFCAGDPEVGQAFEDLRIEVLRLPRDLAALRQEVLAMRARMLEAHGNKDPQRFHVKHDPGGLIDVEFIVQYLVLGHAHEHADLTKNLGNIALLGMAAGHGLIPAELAHQVQEAYRELRRRQHALRLNEKSGLGMAPAEAATHRAAVRALWEVVFGEG
ncbi:MAG: bifunctional [glutamate--ammonia ligase]-adenylyl-L-tyrosine phosphorylase/[glutamate--ammonia-ligase] adenylyltransferase [Betaproteobacteria bacterium]|nr:bifunctional [glutamate--ammonia ligase]-adenylyl-L-tyrosine phosphorylase/[glutamate--ammonia-ligase] adenylyltransferase [Betaproteobacteria bacterium]